MTIKLGENVRFKRFPERSGMVIGVYANGFCKFRDPETKQVYTAKLVNVERMGVAATREKREQKWREWNGRKVTELIASIPPERLAEVQRLAEANGVDLAFTWRAMNENG